MSILPELSFGAPWILAALAALPVIFWLLRVTPPSPRRVVFPPFRLLLGLAGPQETPARTPPWLLMLRILTAALVIVGLAAPSIGRVPALAGHGPLVLFLDNGWAAAEQWDEREAAISDALAGAARAGRPVAIVDTATPAPVALLDAGQAARNASNVRPQSWFPDRRRAAADLARANFLQRPEILWLSDGIDYGDAQEVARLLLRVGPVRLLSDAPGKSPLALKPVRSETDGFLVTVIRADAGDGRAGTVMAMDAHGGNLASAQFRFPADASETATRILLPLEIRNETQRIAISSHDSAGAVQLFGTGSRRHAVGLVAANNTENQQPLLSDLYYLERALAPYSEVRQGTISDALERNVSVLILADVGTIGGEDHDRVAKFVSDGGVLVRFAGGRMTTNVDDLVPVKLRVGGRYLGGALAWAAPQHLAAFPDSSPFRGLTIPPDVAVSRQVLAEPSVELGERSWAQLTDGTPLVTAVRRDRGWIVLFHVTANPAWSSLPLSGLYVEMLRRILELAGGARPADLDPNAILAPYASLDGFGRLQKAPDDALAVRASAIGNTRPSPVHPPGLYGNEGALLALNAVGPGTVLRPLGDLGIPAALYTGRSALMLEAPLLALAIALFLVDAVISLWLRGYLSVPGRFFAARAPLLLLALLLLPASHAKAGSPAQPEASFAMKAALDTRLAYVLTGIADVDEMSKAGLMGLGAALKARTSYEPQDPVGVDPARDDLTFFPLLYWPMDPRERDLTPQALSKISDYMRNGGTILFDTRDLTLGAARGPQSAGAQTLRRLIAKLDLPPLEPVSSDHVLTKAFYLLQDFPGRWDGGKVWVEALPPPDPDRPVEPARGGDGVSPVIIGANDWAAAWATDAQGRPLVDPTPGGAEQREMAIRFGINVVMYALTGNYKTDQVHVPALLERLGH